MSAQTNLAVADKYNAMSELVARISGEYGLENTRQAGRNAINTANVQASAAKALSAQGHKQDMEYTENILQILIRLVHLLLIKHLLAKEYFRALLKRFMVG